MKAVALAGAALLALNGCMPGVTWRALAPDHRTVVEAIEYDGLSCIRVLPDRASCFDGVALRELAFSADGRHLAYPALVGDDWVVVRDRRMGPRWAGVASLRYSPSGTRLAYAAARGGHWLVVVDDVPGEPFDSLLAGSITFDPTSRRIAYAAHQGGLAHVVVDGVVGPGYPGVGHIRFNGDGARVGYVARTGTRAVVILDEVAGPSHEAIAEFVLSASGRHQAYAARDGGAFWVITDRSTLGPYDSAWALGYHTPDEILSYVVRTEAGQAVVFGGVPGPIHQSVEVPVSADSALQWGYIAHDSTGASVVFDGTVLRHEAQASDLVFSADGRRHAYIAARGDSSFVIDERRAHPFDLVVDGSLVFVRGGAAWACLAGDRRRQQLFVVVENRVERRRFDWSEFLAETREVGLEAADTIDSLVRAWVAAEAELILTGSAGRTH